MTPSHSIAFDAFVPRLRAFIDRQVTTGFKSDTDAEFNALALELFALQFANNPVLHALSKARGCSPDVLKDWHGIPALHAGAFKQYELTSLPAADRSHTFHSSGTTGQQPSRHFHNANSLAIYEASLLPWFERHLLPDDESGFAAEASHFLFLTPTDKLAPNSSLVHMFATIRRELAPENSTFAGTLASDGSWTLDLPKILELVRDAIAKDSPVLLFGTAFNFVHLLDELAAAQTTLALPEGSRIMETGGYKGRSRSLPKAELHALLSRTFGLKPDSIITEYGMSELSSQAYDLTAGQHEARAFRFPPWVRVQLISPETGREVSGSQTGLLRIFDLANVYSVMAVQTEDLAIRRGDGFELLGRAETAEPRGCSLQSL